MRAGPAEAIADSGMSVQDSCNVEFGQAFGFGWHRQASEGAWAKSTIFCCCWQASKRRR